MAVKTNLVMIRMSDDEKKHLKWLSESKKWRDRSKRKSDMSNVAITLFEREYKAEKKRLKAKKDKHSDDPLSFPEVLV